MELTLELCEELKDVSLDNEEVEESIAELVDDRVSVQVVLLVHVRVLVLVDDVDDPVVVLL